MTGLKFIRPASAIRHSVRTYPDIEKIDPDKAMLVYSFDDGPEPLKRGKMYHIVPHQPPRETFWNPSMQADFMSAFPLNDGLQKSLRQAFCTLEGRTE